MQKYCNNKHKFGVYKLRNEFMLHVTVHIKRSKINSPNTKKRNMNENVEEIIGTF